MFLIYLKNGLVVAPDYQQYFSSHAECHQLMTKHGIMTDEYDVCPVVYSEDLSS